MGSQEQAAADPIVGIDLGTTNSLVAWSDGLAPRVLTDDAGRALLPSVVRFEADASGRFEPTAIGTEARAHAVEHPRTTLYSVKRLMGRGVDDVAEEMPYLPYTVVGGEHDTARILLGDGDRQRVVSPQEVSALILGALRRRAEAHLGRPVRRAVITVPAYFDDAQRQATRDAGRIAGLDVVRIVNEPTAAALAYNLGQRHGDATVAVFDLGGGTFDISILRLQHTEGGVVDQVLSTDGDTHLGGDDVDRMLIALIQREVAAQFFPDTAPDDRPGLFPPATRQAFRNFAEAAKVRLSTQPGADIEIDLGGGRVYRRTIERHAFEGMIEPWVERAVSCCRRALDKANLGVADIERVIMVGGSTRIPLVRERVGAFFEAEPYTAVDPDQVVAMGAAVQASILAGAKRDTLLLDVIPLSLGIETLGGAVAKMIMANTTIPARATERFSTYVDGQTSVKIHVLQGERELVKDCRSLGQFELTGVPPMPAGLPKLEVTFLVDANGILTVRAVEQRSGKAARLQIVPNHGLTRAEVERMEAESFTHARADMVAHQLIDLRNQARLDMRAIERQVERVGDELDAAYRQAIDAAVADVKRFIDDAGADPTAFHQALDAMDKTAVRLAEVAIRRSLQEDPPPTDGAGDGRR